MIKNFTILRRPPGTKVEQFYAEWQNAVAPLFATIPGLTKYTLYLVHTLPNPAFPATDAPVDGIAETWFESPDALREAMKTPEFQDAVAEERRVFGTTDHFTHMVQIDREVEIVTPKEQNR